MREVPVGPFFECLVAVEVVLLLLGEPELGKGDGSKGCGVVRGGGIDARIGGVSGVGLICRVEWDYHSESGVGLGLGLGWG